MQILFLFQLHFFDTVGTNFRLYNLKLREVKFYEAGTSILLNFQCSKYEQRAKIKHDPWLKQQRYRAIQRMNLEPFLMHKVIN